MSAQTQNTDGRVLRKIGQNGSRPDRDAFCRFCTYTAPRTRSRGDGEGVLTAHDLDKLLVDQNWCCAVSGIAFEAPGDRSPFGPSVDRIKAGGKYAIGNVRIVCNIVNLAMNEWGEDALHRLVREMSGSET